MRQNKKLGDMHEFTQLVLDGVTPEDIAHKFDVAVSTVHNYKRLLKDQGLDVPNVRGKRPSGIFNANELDPDVGTGFEAHVPLISTPALAELPGGDPDGRPPQVPTHVVFVMEGLQVTVDGSALSVDIAHDRMIIRF